MTEGARTDRRTERAQRTLELQRAAVLAAAAMQFERNGFEQATMAAIARQAGVAVGSLYKLFPSKEALHTTLLERRAAALLAHGAAAVAAPGGTPGGITGGTPGGITGVIPDTATGALRADPTLWSQDLPAAFVDGNSERRERSAEAKRGEILAAALRVFQAEGYFRAAMADIAAEAGMATGTLYNFFPSKEALFHTLIEQKAGEFFAYLRGEVDGAEGAVMKIARLVEAECAFYAANRDFLHIYISARTGFEWAAKQDLGAAFRRQYALHLAWVRSILAEGMAEGVLRPMDPAEMAQAFVGMLNATLFEWTIAHALPPPAVRAQQITELFLRGAQIEPGALPHGR
jgi:AcrR family transcriptional regulator